MATNSIINQKPNNMKKVTELKDGMKVLIPFEVRELKENDTHYPFKCVNDRVALFLTKDCENLRNEAPLEIYEQESIPTLTPVEMEVSYNEIHWTTMNIIGKVGNFYKDVLGNDWLHARPIQKTVTLEIPESELTEELRKYLKS